MLTLSITAGRMILNDMIFIKINRCFVSVFSPLKHTNLFLNLKIKKKSLTNIDSSLDRIV